ncbi:AtpZ/AtpI family protein [Candidatus Methylospira mobilis]|uniref:AtpZ/AtpI family protein n=1 Tax=Candidatus Methylospira mobilis TaxID=1808979 RepID=A0A5Q0BCN2_9GAMM|nr:AtpZ/AtpI family protein [Candidatus Methylospira mobilis]QFY41683.1 AtpZ/AtpI family protein [Candidatus Methylospira mobilis]WNV06535.1 AtpZ/AtpI family protein [Candidatus Methylospira mobilis]
MNHRNRLIERTRLDIERLERKERKPATWAGMLFYGGTLGLLFTVPLVAGAYLGRWLDTLVPGYSVRWTLSLILLGIAVGIYNVLHFLRGKT